MNLLNLYKTKYITLLLCFFFLSTMEVYAQYFQSIEKNVLGCWKFEDSEINENFLFLENNIVIIKDQFGKQKKAWEIGKDSLVIGLRTYKNLGGYVLKIDDSFFAVISVSKKRLVLMDLDRGADILSLKNRKCNFCKRKQ